MSKKIWYAPNGFEAYGDEEIEAVNEGDKMTLDDKRMLISEVLEKVPLPSLKGKSTRKASRYIRTTRRNKRS